MNERKTGPEKVVEAWLAGKKCRAGPGGTDGEVVWLYNTALALRGTVKGREITPDPNGSIFVRCAIDTYTTRKWLSAIPGVCAHLVNGELHMNGRPWDGSWTEPLKPRRAVDAVPLAQKALEGLDGVRVERQTMKLLRPDLPDDAISWESPEAKEDYEKEAIVFVDVPKAKSEARKRLKAAGLTVYAPRYHPNRLYVTLMEPA